MAQPASTRSSAPDAAATRRRIMVAGAVLFAERGYAASSMRQLAERAGVSLSASYYHFPGKMDVLLAIMADGMGRLERGAGSVLARNLPPIERLPALVRSHVEVHLTEPELCRVADAELRALDFDARNRIVARRDRYESIFRKTLAEGVERGCFDPALDIALTAIAIITTSTATVEWWSPEGRLSVEETAEGLSRLALAMAFYGGDPLAGRSDGASATDRA